MRELKPLFAALAAMLLLAPGATAAQSANQDMSGPWTAPDARITFPEQIGEYRRVSIHTYAPRYWSVGYNRYVGDKLIAVTIYLYPWQPGDTCEDRYRERKRTILSFNKSATLVSEDLAPSPGGKRLGVAYHARFAMDRDGPLRSESYDYCKAGSTSWVSFRATGPADGPFDGEAQSLLRAINWPTAVAD